MKILKNPKINALLISVISACHALLFIFTSNHVEFIRLFSHSKTLNSLISGILGQPLSKMAI